MLRRALMLVMNLAAAVAAAALPAGESPMIVERLRCEYLENPLGIDTARPRLSWVLRSDRRGEGQSAWQVLVSSSEEGLKQDWGDLWDSGKVDSTQTAQVEYGGVTLGSRQPCFWKVRVWDLEGRPSAYSAPAKWEMGLLEPEDWQGEWIGTGREILPVISLDGATWISSGELGDEASSAGETVEFEKEVELPSDRRLLTARFRVASTGPCKVTWDGELIGETSGDWASLDYWDVAARATPGKHRIALSVRRPDSPTSAAVAAKLEVIHNAGGPLRVLTDASWELDGGKKAQELVRWGEAPWIPSTEPVARVNAQSAPHLRRTFDIDGKIQRARAYVCGLGYHEFRVNGRKVGDAWLEPAYTAYDRRALYATYDVTEYLKEGPNALGVILGSGWYDVHTLAEWNFDSAPWRRSPRMILDLYVELKDGRTVRLGSDGEWKWSPGPVTFDSIYEGESYDARLEMPGWDTVQFYTGSWKPVALVSPPGGQLRAQQVQPIRATQVIKPVKISEPKPGVYVYDLGQNIAGVPEISLDGPAGTSVTLRCGERLLPDGTVGLKEIEVYTRNRDSRHRFQTDVYILKGKGRETWAPRFTYHGFQYVEVTGASGALTLDDLRGIVLHTDLETVGRFTCSNPLLNRIEECTLWSYVGNAHGIPTDCPTREKNGWTADAHLATELALYHYDAGAFYTKWLNDLADAQLENGDLPGIVPSGGWGYGIGIGPAWDSAYVLIPWYLYEYYGDTRILAEHFDGMRRYVDFLTGRAEDGGIITYGLGDWVAFDTKTSNALTSTAYYYRDAVILAEAAALLGREEDARKYADLAASIKKAFNSRFFNPETGLYDNGSQTAQSCALYQGLVEPEHREAVLQRLVEAIERRDYQIDTGILGSKYVLNVLLDGGRADVAWRMVTRRALPSWGYWIDQGATTLWEHWPGSDSLNHVMFGEVSAWFFKALAGIQADEPGFRSFTVRPQLVGDLKAARGEVLTISGQIVSDWKLEDDRFQLIVQVPANTRATVYVPASDPGSVKEGEKAAEKATGVRFLKQEQGCCVYELTAGNYHFTSRIETHAGS